jgi:hypothetical protein
MPVLGQISCKVVGFHVAKTGFPRVCGKPGYGHSVMLLIGTQLTDPTGSVAFRPTLRGGLAFSEPMTYFLSMRMPCHTGQ